MGRIKTKLLEDSEKAKIRKIVDKEAAKMTEEVELLAAVEKQLNESLDDNRLDTKKGLLDALDDLRTFNKYFGCFITIYVNGNQNTRGEMHVWFEV